MTEYHDDLHQQLRDNQKRTYKILKVIVLSAMAIGVLIGLLTGFLCN